MMRGVKSYEIARSGRGYLLRLDCGHSKHVLSLPPTGKLSASCWCCGSDCSCTHGCARDAALEREEQAGKDSR